MKTVLLILLLVMNFIVMFVFAGTTFMTIIPKTLSDEEYREIITDVNKNKVWDLKVQGYNEARHIDGLAIKALCIALILNTIFVSYLFRINFLAQKQEPDPV